MNSTLSKIVVLLVMVVAVVACQKHTFETGNAKEPASQPAYSVQPALNGGTAPVAPAK